MSHYTERKKPKIWGRKPKPPKGKPPKGKPPKGKPLPPAKRIPSKTIRPPKKKKGAY